MIKGRSMTTAIPDVEMMFVAGELVGGSGNVDLALNVEYSELTVEQQAIYDDALSLVGDVYFNEITNTIAELSIDRTTSTVLSDATETVDFDTLSEADKDKLRDILALFVELNT